MHDGILVFPRKGSNNMQEEAREAKFRPNWTVLAISATRKRQLGVTHEATDWLRHPPRRLPRSESAFGPWSLSAVRRATVREEEKSVS